MNPRGMSHVALCTKDFDRSMHFYRDLLGFQVAQEGTTVEEGEYQQGIYKKKNQQVKFAILRHGKKKATPYGLNEDAPVIALLAPTQSKADWKADPGRPNWYFPLRDMGQGFEQSSQRLSQQRRGICCSAARLGQDQRRYDPQRLCQRPGWDHYSVGRNDPGPEVDSRLPLLLGESTPASLSLWERARVSVLMPNLRRPWLGLFGSDVLSPGLHISSLILAV